MHGESTQRHEAHRNASTREALEEYDMFVTHRCRDFGMPKSRASLVTERGLTTAQSTGVWVYVYSQDFTIYGVVLSLTCGEKIAMVQQLALVLRTDYRHQR